MVGNTAANSERELKALFDPYGLVYAVKLIYPTSSTVSQASEAVDMPEKQEKPFGFVTFYSVGAARLAFKTIRKNSWNDRNAMYVQFSRKRKREEGQEDEKIPLPIHSALELANYYLGFDTWSSSIVGGFKRIETTECSNEVQQWAEKRFVEQSPSGPNKAQSKLPTIAMAYSCKVVYKFQDGHVVEAEGQGMAIGYKADEVIPMAKKIAVTHARKEAFARMVIVILNKKVGIRILAHGPSKPHLITDSELDQNVTNVQDPQDPTQEPSSSSSS
jgi:RNA recognition motif-containing protein